MSPRSRPCLTKRGRTRHAPYALHRSKDDPDVFWTTEIYADDAAFAAHGASEVHAAAAPVFTDLIAGSDVIIGETLMAKGLSG
jgi:(4S)-4-hydroxy-5-phosphonooxypentane-2,3-dione isomerase